MLNPEPSGPYPSSPPPSFDSRSPSPSSRLIFSQDPLHSEADRTLENTFGNDNDDSDGDDEIDDRQRLMRGNPTVEDTSRGGQSSQTQTNNQSGGNSTQGGLQAAAAPAATPSASSRIIHDSHDGVFANLAAKPERGEKLEDLPPVSVARSRMVRVMLTDLFSRMSKLQLMQRRHTGRQPSLPLACPPMKSSWTAFPLAPYSPLSGTA